MPVEPSEAPPSAEETLASDFSLVSLAEARTFLLAEEGDDPKDALLELIIPGLSKRIVQKTGNLYVNPAADDGVSRRSYDFSPNDRRVDIDFARELGAVEVTGAPQDEEAWTLLDAATDYYAEPVGMPVVTSLRFMTALELPAQGVGWGGLALHRLTPDVDLEYSTWPSQERQVDSVRATVRVSAKFGLGADSTTAPANVKLALLMWLQNIHKRDIAFVSDTVGVASATMKMPADVEELLLGESDTLAGAEAI
jgi:hypothetical protein